MAKERFTLRAATYLLLIRDRKVLLLRRFNTGWADGSYTLPAGHVDGNETIKQAMMREASEEIDIHIEEEDLTVVHTLHIKTDAEYIAFFLLASQWKGEPKNNEPNKADILCLCKTNRRKRR